MLCSYKASKPCEILGSPSDIAEILSYLVCYIMVTAKELFFGLPNPQDEGLQPF
jgi:hypothetical protein